MMKWMKMLSVLAVALLMSLSLAACGDGNDAGKTSTEGNSSVQEQTSSEDPSSDADEPSSEAEIKPTGEALSVAEYDTQIANIMQKFMGDATEMATALQNMPENPTVEDQEKVLDSVVKAVDSMDKAIADVAVLNPPTEYAELTELFGTASKNMSAAVKTYHEGIDKLDEDVLLKAQTELNAAVADFQAATAKYSKLKEGLAQ